MIGLELQDQELFPGRYSHLFCLSTTSRLVSISLPTPSDLRNKTVYFIQEGKGAQQVTTHIDLAPPNRTY